MAETPNKNKFSAFSKQENTNSVVDDGILLDEVDLEGKEDESEEEEDTENEYENVKVI